MKIVIMALLLHMVAACSDEKKDKMRESVPVAKDSLVKKQSDDYFETYNERSLQKDILLDTAEYTRKDSCAYLSILVPKRNPANRIFYQRINKLVREAREDYRKEEGDSGNCDAMHFRHFWIEPMHLYQSGRYISYVMREGSGYAGMPSTHANYVMNFDLETKKEIRFEDYFQLKTNNDSFLLCKAISRAIGDEDRLTRRGYEHEWSMFLESNFAFDSEYVYFFFDRYGIVGWGGPTAVFRKKFLSAYINPKYQ